MARTGTTKRYYNFVGGLNTDSTDLLPAENSCRVLNNVVLGKTGEISRRFGLERGILFDPELDGEPVTTFESLEADTYAADVYMWSNINNEHNLEFTVIRAGPILTFIQTGSPTVSLSSVVGSLDITQYQQDATLSNESNLSFASGKGFLFVTGAGTRPFYIEYTPDYVVGSEDFETFTGYAVTLYVRDTEGLIEAQQTSERPEELSQVHSYNLSNQGWTPERMKEFNTVVGAFPSNSDVMHLGYRVDPVVGVKVWDANEIARSELGNTPAARGRIVLDALQPDRVAFAGGLPSPEYVLKKFRQGVDYTYTSADNFGGGQSYYAWVTVFEGATEPFVVNPDMSEGPRSNAFYYGRIWYGSHRGRIYFSQLLENEENISKFYQEQDPTSEQFNELVDTDGGYLSIPEMGVCLSLISFGTSLLVFASNGIWSISGGDTGFTANNTSVSKVSNIAVGGIGAIVESEGGLFFWTPEGVFAASSDSVSGRLNIKTVSLGRISKLLNTISPFAIQNATSFYDIKTNRIFWSYQKNMPASDPIRYNNESILIYDISLNAFYTWEIARDQENGVDNFFHSHLFRRRGVSKTRLDVPVLVGSDPVTDGFDNPVVTAKFVEATRGSDQLEALCWRREDEQTAVFFVQFTSRNFADFVGLSDEGITYDSTVETVPESLSDGVMDKAATYLFLQSNVIRLNDPSESATTMLDKDISHGVRVSSRWDWATVSSSGKWSNSQQGIRPNRYQLAGAVGANNEGYSLKTAKLKIRGSGRAVSFRFDSEQSKDFLIMGWAVPVTSETVP